MSLLQEAQKEGQNLSQQNKELQAKLNQMSAESRVMSGVLHEEQEHVQHAKTAYQTTIPVLEARLRESETRSAYSQREAEALRVSVAELKGRLAGKSRSKSRSKSRIL